MLIDAGRTPKPAPTGACALSRRLAEAHPRAAGAIGASMWILAIALLTLYAHRDVRIGQMGFMLSECWLIGLGCVGQPMLTLYVLGAEPTPSTCERVATGAYTAAALVTVLLAAGQLHVNVLVASFVLILPLAFAIQSGNAAQAVARRARDQASGAAEGEERGWLACALAIGEAHSARDARLNSLIQDAESTAELRYDLQAFENAIALRDSRGVVTQLRAVNGGHAPSTRDRD